MRRLLLMMPVLAGLGLTQTAGLCDCDPAKPEMWEARQCSLCREAEKQPEDVGIFLLKDNNPRKPNRWLALPRRHAPGKHHLSELTAEERTALWTAAIKKAKELWGDEWGVAYNGDQVRTQCHTHIHIGKLLRGVEEGKFLVISKPSQIPVPENTGLWIHPEGTKMHVHINEQICETVLLR